MTLHYDSSSVPTDHFLHYCSIRDDSLLLQSHQITRAWKLTFSLLFHVKKISWYQKEQRFSLVYLASYLMASFYYFPFRISNHFLDSEGMNKELINYMYYIVQVIVMNISIIIICGNSLLLNCHQT